MRPGGSYRGKTGSASLGWARRFMTHHVILPPSIDAVQKSWLRISGKAGARVAVGTRIAERPPHRSRRALPKHRALALDSDEEPSIGPRM
jgi:hypothetical protein